MQNPLEKIDYTDIGKHILGCILGRGINGSDGIFPHEFIRTALDEYDDEEINSGFMIGKSNLSDSSAFHLVFQPLFNPKIFQTLPRLHICQHMKQIIIDIVRAKSAKFFLKTLLNTFHRMHKIVWKFCCNIYLFTEPLAA